ncbi:hypothetical protein [Litorimonas sp. WD9-15]|uniref:hypothetical protein n=1 Tax=Litorimonas sp. WD9-15 TaxID=3418716 RepID=UPI003D006580
MAGSLYPKHSADFLAEIEILPLGKTYRTKHPKNGIRWALAYPDDFNLGNFTVSDVWPDFLDSEGNSISKSEDLQGVYKAEMHILFPEMVAVHSERLKFDANFYCTEGRDIVAHGKMIKFFKKP